MSKYPIVYQIRRVGVRGDVVVDVVRQTMNIKALENCLFYVVKEPVGVKLTQGEIESAILVGWPHLKDRGLYEWTGRLEVMTDDELDGLRGASADFTIEVQTREVSKTVVLESLSDAIETVREFKGREFLCVFVKRGYEDLYARRGDHTYLNRLGA